MIVAIISSSTRAIGRNLSYIVGAVMKEVIDLVKAAMWPSIAFFALVMFYVPVNSVMMSLARRADQIQVFKLGYLELNIKESDLPKATKKTAEILTQFDEEMVRRLMFVSSDVRFFGHCYRPDISSSDAERRALEKLHNLKQINFKKDDKNIPNGCIEYYSGEITDDGFETRNFLLKFMSTQFKGSSQSG